MAVECNKKPVYRRGTARARCQLKSFKILRKWSRNCIWKALQPMNDLQGHSRSLPLVPFHRPCDFLFHCKYIPVLYRFRDINTFLPKCLDVTWPCPRPFQGRFVIGRVGHAMFNLPTKFEVSIFTHYGDMKGIGRCRKWDGSGWLWVTQGHRQCHHSMERIWHTQTDTQTQGHGIYRAEHNSRGKNLLNGRT